MAEERTAYRTCPLCEATCGLELTLDGRSLPSVRGDKEDVFSHGYLCPKAFALIDLERDPDIVRRPLVRDGEAFREASWEEAFARIDGGLRPIIAEGPDAVAVYLGNPNVHNLAGLLYNQVLLRALNTANLYSATSVDQMPKQVAAAYMFGSGLSIPIPDVDRTDHLLILGANPLVSNGSLFTARTFPAASGRFERAAARSWWSIRVERRPPGTPTNITRSFPGPTRTCCSGSSTRCSPKASRRPAVWSRTRPGSTWSVSWPSRSRRRPSRR